MKLKLCGVVLTIALGALLYGCNAQVGAQRSTSAATASGTPAISITPMVQDLGDVSMSKGTVSTLFAIANTGNGDLVIQDMETSCMCTEAALVVSGGEGPRFGMSGHGQHPVGWSASLKPGERADLKVYYDPTAHRELLGPVTRVVRIYSNDPQQPYVDVKIELNQVH